MIETKIELYKNIYVITVINGKPSSSYAMYVYHTDGEMKDKIYTFPYRKKNIFVYTAPPAIDHHSNSISFLIFIKDEVSSKIEMIRVYGPYNELREAIKLDKLKFDKSFDADISVGNWHIPIKYQINQDSKKHIILLNGAIYNEVVYPTYLRWSWADQFKGNCLNIFDPTINLAHDYTLGWYRGLFSDKLENKIHSLLQSLIKEKNLSNNDLVFYGSSGGGWAALKFAELFPGSLAVAINPQINIFKYHSQKAVINFLKYSFDGLTEKEVLSKYLNEIEINTTPFSLKDVSLASKFILVQNKQDKHHYNDHFLPFWHCFSSKNETGFDDQHHNYALIYDHESGHAGEPPEVFDNIIKIIEEIS